MNKFTATRLPAYFRRHARQSGINQTHRSGFLITCCTMLLLTLSLTIDLCHGAELPQVIATLEQGYERLSDLQAEFTQITTVAAIKREEKGNGELFIKKPQGSPPMFRFNYIRPKQQIISNGKKIWYYLPENKQVMITDMATLIEGGGGTALSYLTGMGRVSKDFTVSFVGNGRDKRGNYLLELIPRKPSQAMAKLRLTIAATAVERFMENHQAADPFPITASVVTDHSGNNTAIEFSKIRVNRGIGNDRFAFKIPTGVEVINPR
jgi:outer membrane lipoprotein carrier protein